MDPDDARPSGAAPLPADMVAGLADLPVGLVATDAAGQVTFVNRAFVDAAGPGAPCTVGRPLADLLGSGARLPIAWTLLPEGAIGVLAPAPDAAEALRDPLTGLGNRARIAADFERLAEARAARGGAIAVLVLDLDRFRDVLDRMGHAAGDALLRKAAQRLRRALDPGAVACRLSGDEFAVLLHDPAGPDDAGAPEGGASRADREAGRILEVIARPFVIDGEAVLVGASVGIAWAEPQEAAADGALRRAGIAMGEAKRRGRGRSLRYAAPMLAAIEARQAIDVELRRAVLLRQIELRYRPRMTLGGAGTAEGTVRAFEALPRWNHPGRGIVPPSEFVPVAEATGVIAEIGAWILREACRAAADWPGAVALAVNVSPAHLRSPGFAEAVAEALGAAGLDAARLELEIPEAVLLEDEPALGARLEELRGLGVRLSLDASGSALGSLERLRRLPFDRLRVDGAWAARGAAMADLGLAVDVEMPAAGTATRDQLALMRAQGCPDARGLVMGHPIPAEEITAFLEREGGVPRHPL